MTKEEAINTLARFKRYISGGGVVDRTANQAIDMAIKALEQEPCGTGWVGIEEDYPVSVKQVLNITAETGALTTQVRVMELPRYKQPELCNLPQLDATYEDGDELDEAIRHCDEIVQDITWFCNSPSKYIEQRRHESAVKLRQLASWLRELKRLRTEVYFLKAEKENEPVDLLVDVPCKTCKWRVTTTEKCEECIDGVSDNYEVQEPCEDCVSRQAAIDAAENAFVRGLLASPDIRRLPSAQPETAKRIVGKSRDGMTLWYQCDMCNEPVDAQDDFCRGCGRRLTDG